MTLTRWQKVFVFVITLLVGAGSTGLIGIFSRLKTPLIDDLEITSADLGINYFVSIRIY